MIQNARVKNMKTEREGANACRNAVTKCIEAGWHIRNLESIDMSHLSVTFLEKYQNWNPVW